jgi:hypothetical protein
MVQSQAPAVGSNQLTLHAQPIRAVLGLQDQAITVLASILGSWRRALSPAPVGALSPTCRPLAPGSPSAIHCHEKTQHQVRERSSY